MHTTKKDEPESPPSIALAVYIVILYQFGQIITHLLLWKRSSAANMEWHPWQGGTAVTKKGTALRSQ